MPEQAPHPRAKPLLPIFHGSSSASAQTTKILGSNWHYKIQDNALLPSADTLTPLVYTTYDPILAVAYALRHTAPKPSIVSELCGRTGQFSAVSLIVFQTFDETGKDTTFDEYLKPLTIFHVDAEGREVFYNEDNAYKTGMRLGSKWIIHQEAACKAIATLNSIHDVAATGVDIYMADGKTIDMKRKRVDPSLETGFRSYLYSYNPDKHEVLSDAFDRPETRKELLANGTLKYINPSLAGPPPEHSAAINLIMLRELLEDNLDYLRTVARAQIQTSPHPPKI